MTSETERSLLRAFASEMADNAAWLRELSMILADAGLMSWRHEAIRRARALESHAKDCSEDTDPMGLPSPAPAKRPPPPQPPQNTTYHKQRNKR